MDEYFSAIDKIETTNGRTLTLEEYAKKHSSPKEIENFLASRSHVDVPSADALSNHFFEEVLVNNALNNDRVAKMAGVATKDKEVFVTEVEACLNALTQKLSDLASQHQSVINYVAQIKQELAK